MTTVLLTRQPVLNRRKTIIANRLLVHAEDGGEAADELNALIDAWPAKLPVLVSLHGSDQCLELMNWIAPENTVVEIEAAAANTPITRELLTQLADAGTAFCLSDYTGTEAVDSSHKYQYLLARQNVSPKDLPALGMPIAIGVRSPGEFDAAMAAGYGGAAGWFMMATSASGRSLQAAHAHIVRIINLVRRNAEVREIETALKRDVALSFKLLRYINSAGFGLMCEVQSFRHAVSILGYDKLNKWLSLLLVTASKDPTASALMQTSITRGRLMETLGERYVDKSELDNLFVTGAFSMLDRLLGTQMDAIVAELSLPEPVQDALLDRAGAYTPLLRLARACELETPATLAEHAALLGLDASAVNRAHLSALAYADSLQHGG
ncbi:MAG: HDOD domain-containing protein [Rhodocyclaceae bacterium]|nr:HDOD domain-containing protein [Rhodocyclaceae bacterium]